MKRIFSIILMIIIIGVTKYVSDDSANVIASSGGASSQSEVRGRVDRVIDGDSLYLVGIEKQIRLFGVDAPEREEADYREATDTLKRAVQGRTLRCEIVEHDKYGRIVGHCYAGDTDLNRKLIFEGPSKEYCRFSKNAFGTC